MSSTVIESDPDGFIKVESKFKYKSIPKKKKNKNKSKTGYMKYQDSSSWTVEDMVAQLESYKEKLVSSQFYQQLEPLLLQHLVPRQCHDLICYGVGSMQDSIPARYQFMLSLLIRDMVKIKGTMSFYDPVMTPLDRQALAHYNITVIDQDEQCKRSVDRATLFYMPHCARLLYSNTISANWSKEQLEHITFVANDFTDIYVTSQPDTVLKRECPYLLPASTIIDSVPFPDFDINNVFNNLAIQHFPLLKLPSSSDDPFWQFEIEEEEEEEENKK